jgi:hypothetical protein
VYVPPSPTTLEELKIRIKDAVHAAISDMISNVWEEFDYRIDVCRAAGGGHIKHLLPNQIKLDYFKNIFYFILPLYLHF